MVMIAVIVVRTRSLLRWCDVVVALVRTAMLQRHGMIVTATGMTVTPVILPAVMTIKWLSHNRDDYFNDFDYFNITVTTVWRL